MRSFLFAAAITASLSACASPGNPPAPAAALGHPIQLSPGQQIALPQGAQLRYVAVKADSRCPPNVQCIRAGDADVGFEFTPAGQPARALSLNIPQSPNATIGDWRLSLLSLEFGDAARATVQVDAATP